MSSNWKASLTEVVQSEYISISLTRSVTFIYFKHTNVISHARPPPIFTTVHGGKPALQKSEKIIFLTKAYNVRVTTDKVRAWLHLEGKIIKSRKISQKSWENDPPSPPKGASGHLRGNFTGLYGLKSKSWRKQTPIKIKFYLLGGLGQFVDYRKQLWTC